MTSNDYYQGNISCAITGLHQYSIYVSVAPDTLINRFTAYILAVDTTELAVASKYFLDYGVSQSKNGVQYGFFTPQNGIFQNGYLAGLRSFSMRDNYEFNYTVSNITFDVSVTAYYTDTTNFHFRARLCTPSPYTYYNKVDGLCYNQCPDGTYKV